MTSSIDLMDPTAPHPPIFLSSWTLVSGVAYLQYYCILLAGAGIMVQTFVQQQGLRLYTHPGTNEPPPTNVPSPVPPPDDVVHNPGPSPGNTPTPYPPPPHDQQGHPNCGPCNWISCHGTPVAPNWAALTGLNNG